jgi:hypothetical protein
VPAFNGFSATGFLATLLASEIAGFFELGIRPRYGKNGQAEITGALPIRAARPQPAHRHGQKNNWERGINSSADKLSGEHLVCSPCGYLPFPPEFTVGVRCARGRPGGAAVALV